MRGEKEEWREKSLVVVENSLETAVAKLFKNSKALKTIASWSEPE